jgi:hypothetical protein
MDKKNVLIFPGGTEIGLEIWKSLKDVKDIALYSAGSDVSNHAPYVFKNHLIIPDIHNSKWIECLNAYILEYKIDYIFPAYDDIVIALAKNATKLKAKIISSPLDTCLLTRSKSKTYGRFKNLLPIPRTYCEISEIDYFPVFVKPDAGQGSQGASKVNDLNSLELSLQHNENLVISEYLSGKEFTIDCFTDRIRGLLFCNGRERIRTRAGISMNSKPVDANINKIFTNYANIINNELEFFGAWFFQLKLDASNIFKLLEIAPRISGTMATYRVRGVNFPLLSIYEHERINIEIMENPCDLVIDRALMNRYRHNIKYDRVYIDLDDTIIIGERINIDLMRFLYQAINDRCELILISKSVNDLHDYLKKKRLLGLFDKIIQLEKNESKADYIDPHGSIFIDDSFSERKSVFDRHKIPTFDCSMIELLIDERA